MTPAQAATIVHNEAHDTLYARLVLPIGVEVLPSAVSDRVTVKFDREMRERVAARLENLADALRRWEPVER